MKHDKVMIFADLQSLIKLGNNKAFKYGRDLKEIIKNHSKINLIMDETECDRQWANSESPLRKFCDSYDIPRPNASALFAQFYNNPKLCAEVDPFALWLINTSDKNLQNFRDYMGVWAINTSNIDDLYLYMDHQRSYEIKNVIGGENNNGWANYIAELPHSLPPLNSIVLNDRFLIYHTNEESAEKEGFWGFNNLLTLFNVILPKELKIPFHILIACRHPDLSPDNCSRIVDVFMEKVKKLRKYEITIEFVYSISRHQRNLFSNYFSLTMDRAFNAFRNNSEKINGENKFELFSYFYNPHASGDFKYSMARNELYQIKDLTEAAQVCIPDEKQKNEDIKKLVTESENLVDNRLLND